MLSFGIFVVVCLLVVVAIVWLLICVLLLLFIWCFGLCVVLLLFFFFTSEKQPHLCRVKLCVPPQVAWFGRTPSEVNNQPFGDVRPFHCTVE